MDNETRCGGSGAVRLNFKKGDQGKSHRDGNIGAKEVKEKVWRYLEEEHSGRGNSQCKGLEEEVCMIRLRHRKEASVVEGKSKE